MTNHDGADLHKKVERYEMALDELRGAHQGVKGVLADALLIERLRQLGGEIGFSLAWQDAGLDQSDLASLDHQLPEMSESWSG